MTERDPAAASRISEATAAAQMAAAARGDVDAFLLLCQAYTPLLTGVALRMVGDRDHAEKAVHEVLVEAWRSCRVYDPARFSVRVWWTIGVRTVALRRSKGRRAKRMASTHDTMIAQLGPAVEAADLGELRAKVRRVLDALTGEQRSLLQLAYFDGLTGRSYITNAKGHVGNTPLVKLDIKKFYPSIDSARVYRFFFETLKCSPDVSGLLTKLTTYEEHVPTGSCASQLLAFFAAKPMFDALNQLATESGLVFSCYVDDMTFSGTEATPKLLWAVKQVVHSHGLAYHKDQCYTAGQQKLVTGVIVDGDRIAVLPSREHELWRRMHRQ